MKNLAMIIGVAILVVIEMDVNDRKHLILKSIAFVCATALIIVPVILEYKRY